MPKSSSAESDPTTPLVDSTRSRKAVIALLVSLSAAAALAAPPEITCDALRLRVLRKEAGLVIVDVRPPDDFAKSHVQGARNVPSKDVTFVDIPRASDVVVYCSEAVCPLSKGAAERLLASGYNHVELLQGGYAEWLKRGYPVEKSRLAAGPATPRERLKDADADLKSGAAVAVDVRPVREFAAGHLPGAISVPLEDLDSNLIKLPHDKELLVYDRQASRAKTAVAKLAKAAFNAKELSGGIEGWARKGRKLEVTRK